MSDNLEMSLIDSISPKKQTNDFDFTRYYDTSGSIGFVRSVEDLKTTKRHFEIN